jgi:hypothetical protein
MHGGVFVQGPSHSSDPRDGRIAGPTLGAGPSPSHVQSRDRLAAMRVDDFFIDEGSEAVDVDLLEALRAASLSDRSDLEVAIALAELLDEQFVRYGTDSTQTLSDDESRVAMRALRAVLDRLGVPFTPPFRDFRSFHAYWGTHGGYGTWAARRTMVNELFGTLHEELEGREEATLRGDLVEPISPRRATGWPTVDIEIAEMRRHFHSARTPQDYRNVGNDVVAVLEALSAAAYVPSRHLREGETEPAVAQTKDRLARVIEVDFQITGGAELRRLARATIELAQAVKHNPAGSRNQAGIAADAAIQLANMIRRIQEPDQKYDG